ncbi:MAG: OsmC family protein [Planctomycetota bacterium]|jgi:putative redox protein|nr:OsmC family protein [Planctomycetota bacterium]
MATVHVEETREGKFIQHITMGEHTLTADAPASSGGDDRGPNPYDLLLAALGTCTTMTLRMYADHKKWPLERVAVHLTQEKIHATDCEQCEGETGKVDRIERELELHGPLDDTQRERLLQIAGRCPVHRTLMEEKQILTRLRENS